MASAPAIARKLQTGLDGSRRCIVTGDLRPKDELIRFVAAPSGAVIPDFAHNLPGRGLWITAEYAAIDQAARKNLFARAAGVSMQPDPALAHSVAQLFRKRCLDFLGLARSAGIAVLGQPQVEAALKSRKIALLLVAKDAAADSVEKMSGFGIPAAREFSRDELGAALGYEHIVYAGFKKHGLTEKLNLELGRLGKLAGPDSGME